MFRSISLSAPSPCPSFSLSLSLFPFSSSASPSTIPRFPPLCLAFVRHYISSSSSYDYLQIKSFPLTSNRNIHHSPFSFLFPSLLPSSSHFSSYFSSSSHPSSSSSSPSSRPFNTRSHDRNASRKLRLSKKIKSEILQKQKIREEKKRINHLEHNSKKQKRRKIMEELDEEEVKDYDYDEEQGSASASFPSSSPPSPPSSSPPSPSPSSSVSPPHSKITKVLSPSTLSYVISTLPKSQKSKMSPFLSSKIFVNEDQIGTSTLKTLKLYDRHQNKLDEIKKLYASISLVENDSETEKNDSEGGNKSTSSSPSSSSSLSLSRVEVIHSSHLHRLFPFIPLRQISNWISRFRPVRRLTEEEILQKISDKKQEIEEFNSLYSQFHPLFIPLEYTQIMIKYPHFLLLPKNILLSFRSMMRGLLGGVEINLVRILHVCPHLCGLDFTTIQMRMKSIIKLFTPSHSTSSSSLSHPYSFDIVSLLEERPGILDFSPSKLSSLLDMIHLATHFSEEEVIKLIDYSSSFLTGRTSRLLHLTVLKDNKIRENILKDPKLRQILIDDNEDEGKGKGEGEQNPKTQNNINKGERTSGLASPSTPSPSSSSSSSPPPSFSLTPRELSLGRSLYPAVDPSSYNTKILNRILMRSQLEIQFPLLSIVPLRLCRMDHQQFSRIFPQYSININGQKGQSLTAEVGKKREIPIRSLTVEQLRKDVEELQKDLEAVKESKGKGDSSSVESQDRDSPSSLSFSDISQIRSFPVKTLVSAASELQNSALKLSEKEQNRRLRSKNRLEIPHDRPVSPSAQLENQQIEREKELERKKFSYVFRSPSLSIGEKYYDKFVEAKRDKMSQIIEKIVEKKIEIKNRQREKIHKNPKFFGGEENEYTKGKGKDSHSPQSHADLEWGENESSTSPSSYSSPSPPSFPRKNQSQSDYPRRPPNLKFPPHSHANKSKSKSFSYPNEQRPYSIKKPLSIPPSDNSRPSQPTISWENDSEK